MEVWETEAGKWERDEKGEREKGENGWEAREVENKTQINIQKGEKARAVKEHTHAKVGEERQPVYSVTG